MIPKDESRAAGWGGGGRALNKDVRIPYRCRKCGQTRSRKQMLESVDVCKKCRLR